MENETINISARISDYALRIYEIKKDIISNILQLGKTLCEAKTELPHGCFLTLLKTKAVKLSTRTSQRYMALYRAFYGYLDDQSKINIIKDIPASKLAILLSLPDKFYNLDSMQIENPSGPNQHKNIKILDSNKLNELLNRSVEIGGKFNIVKNLSSTHLKKFIKGFSSVLYPPSYSPDIRANKQHRFFDYYSGFVDGEGCLLILHQGGQQFNFIFTITNTHKPVLDSFLDYFKCGTIYKHKRYPHLDTFDLRITHPPDIYEVLTKLELIVKVKQKQLMMYAINLHLSNTFDNFKEIARCAIALDYFNKSKKYEKLNNKSKELIEIIK